MGNSVRDAKPRRGRAVARMYSDLGFGPGFAAKARSGCAGRRMALYAADVLSEGLYLHHTHCRPFSRHDTVHSHITQIAASMESQ